MYKLETTKTMIMLDINHSMTLEGFLGGFEKYP